MLMRWQLAYPGRPIPLIGNWLGVANAPGGIMLPEFYNQLGAMHGTIMVFLGVVPLAVGGFGNFVVPLQIGAPDMAFPKINMASYWVYFMGGVVMLASFFVPAGAANSGWTSYPPLADIATMGQTMWLIGMVLLITSSLLGSINFITTIVQLRTKGLCWMRLPFFVWAQLVTAFLLLLAFPPLEAAGVLQLMDRVAGTSFFMPSGLVVSGKPLEIAGNGNPLLWQHLFWFYSHPAVYIMILPAMGMVSDIVSTFARKPIFGYRAMVYAIAGIAGLGFIVWGHHMFQSGMNPYLGITFTITTGFIALPSAVKVFNWITTCHQSRMRITTPMLFALAFVSMFVIGGLSGIFMAATFVDIYIHDTYYIVAHIHYVLFASSLMGIFGAIYFWFPKLFGKMLNESWGKLHFLLTFTFLNCTFYPMHIVGVAGLPRRYADYSDIPQYAELAGLNQFMTISAFCLGATQLIFMFNVVQTFRKGKFCGQNPWQSASIEWTAQYPVPHGNWGPTLPQVTRWPYDYSVPGAERDFLTQIEVSPLTVEHGGHGEAAHA